MAEDGTAGGPEVASDLTGDQIARRRAERLLALADALGSVTTRDELGEVVALFLADTYSARAAVGFVEGNRFRMSALAGFANDFTDGWRRVRLPLTAASPLTDAVRERRVVELVGPGAFHEAYPHLHAERASSGDDALIALPIVDVTAADSVIGALHVSWPTAHTLSEPGRVLLRTAVAMTAIASHRLDLVERVAQDRFRHALDALLEHVAIGRAVRDDEGRIVDFDLEFLNASSIDGAQRTASELVGRRLLEVYPRFVDNGMYERFVHVTETGTPFLAHRLAYREELPDGPVIDGFWALQVTRFGDGYLAASRDVTDIVAAERAAAEAAEAARALDEERRIAAREHEIAARLQEALVPTRSVGHTGVRLFARSIRADEALAVGGDWYDIVERDDGRLVLAVGDIVGHGLEAAAAMGQLRSWFAALAPVSSAPDELLGHLDRFARTVPGAESSTIACVYLDPATGRIEHSAAGHPPVLVVDADGTTRLLWSGRSGPLGVAARAWRAGRDELAPGATLVLYTDGLVERRGEAIDDGFVRLARCACAHADDSPATMTERIVDELVPDRPPRDDVVIVAVRRR